MENQQNHSPISEQINSHRVLSLGILAVFFLTVKLLLGLILPNKQLIEASDLTSGNILNEVNHQRSLRNLVILNTNGKLGAAAQYKADDMQTRHYFAHVDPDGHYIWDRIVKEGYSPYTQLGENLAIEFYDTDSLISAWMNSPTHRENLLNENFRDQGMGLSLGTPSQGQYYSAIANTFGTQPAQSAPKSPSPTPKSKPVPTPLSGVNGTLSVPTPTPSPTPSSLGASPTPKPKPSPKVTPTPTVVPTPTPLAVPTPLSGVSGTLSVPTPLSETSVPTPLSGVTDTPNGPTPLSGVSGTLSVPTPEASPTYLPTEIRPTKLAENTEQNFKIPVHNTSTPIENTSTTSNQSTPGVVGSSEKNNFNDYNVNRYLILFCGIILLGLALADIKKAIENKFEHLDKKINNVLILLISILVVAFMYWL
jgi:hypothetical protein